MKIIILMARVAAVMMYRTMTNHGKFKGGGKIITNRVQRDHLDPNFACSMSCIICHVYLARPLDDWWQAGVAMMLLSLSRNHVQGFAPDKFLVEVRMESARQAISIISKQLEGRNDLRWSKWSHAINPAITGGNINQHKSIVLSTETNIITKNNIHVYLVEIPSVTPKRLAFWGIWNCGEGPDCSQNLTSVNECGVCCISD